MASYGTTSYGSANQRYKARSPRQLLPPLLYGWLLPDRLRLAWGTAPELRRAAVAVIYGSAGEDIPALRELCPAATACGTFAAVDIYADTPFVEIPGDRALCGVEAMAASRGVALFTTTTGSVQGVVDLRQRMGDESFATLCAVVGIALDAVWAPVEDKQSETETPAE